LCGVVAHHRANQDVGVDDDLLLRPAQPLAAASPICSSVATLRVRPASKPMKDLIDPVGRAA